MNIVINGKKFNFSEINFPILIHGAEKTGSSFFSICLLSQAQKKGTKTLLFSAYPMAKEEFKKQISSHENDALVIDSGDEQVFIKKLQSIPDLKDRVVLIKNIDKYSLKLFNAVKDLKLIIFSGDLDKCQFADSLMGVKFYSKILFSPSKKYPQCDLTDLPKYSGKLINGYHNSVISLDLEEK